MTALLQAKNAFAPNLAVFHKANCMVGTPLVIANWIGAWKPLRRSAIHTVDYIVGPAKSRQPA